MEQKTSDRIDLDKAGLITGISHYYRGEMNRANVWRSRLDVTTNWAIITTAAFLSFGFGSSKMPHFVLILATIFVLFFLIIEARRYKYFDLFRWRVAILNENFFATIIEPSRKPLQENWRALLCDELQHSKFKMSFLEAFGRRLRRNYSWIFLVLAVCWLTKVSIHPTPIVDFELSQIIERAAIFHIIPGWLVFSMGILFNGFLLVVAIVTLKERDEVVRIYPAGKSKLKWPNV
ncbi:MAG: DUF2270 domain-containing protein [bacterium]